MAMPSASPTIDHRPAEELGALAHRGEGRRAGVGDGDRGTDRGAGHRDRRAEQGRPPVAARRGGRGDAGDLGAGAAPG